MFKTDRTGSVFFHYDGKDACWNIWSGGQKLAEFWKIPLSLQSWNTNLSFFMVCVDLLAVPASLLCILASTLFLISVSFLPVYLCSLGLSTWNWTFSKVAATSPSPPYFLQFVFSPTLPLFGQKTATPNKKQSSWAESRDITNYLSTCSVLNGDLVTKEKPQRNSYTAEVNSTPVTWKEGFCCCAKTQLLKDQLENKTSQNLKCVFLDFCGD